MNIVSTPKRVICLGIRPMYEDSKARTYEYFVQPKPLFCRLPVTQSFVDKVTELRCWLVEKDLKSLSFLWRDIVWFYGVTERFHFGIESIVHVSATELFITGKYNFEAESLYRSVSLPISELIEEQVLKSVDTTAFELPCSKALITEIDAKYQSYLRTLDMQEKLEQVRDDLISLADSSVQLMSVENQRYIDSLQLEVAALDRLTSEQELSLESLCARLLYQSLQIALGDWVYFDINRHRKPVQLVAESVSYHEGVIYINGSNITQKGEIGKRQESISFGILNNESDG